MLLSFWWKKMSRNMGKCSSTVWLLKKSMCRYFLLQTFNEKSFEKVAIKSDLNQEENLTIRTKRCETFLPNILTKSITLPCLEKKKWLFECKRFQRKWTFAWPPRSFFMPWGQSLTSMCASNSRQLLGESVQKIEKKSRKSSRFITFFDLLLCCIAGQLSWISCHQKANYTALFLLLASG